MFWGVTDKLVFCGKKVYIEDEHKLPNKQRRETWSGRGGKRN